MSNRKAFTVIEMVMALAILVIVGTMVAFIFRATQRSFMNARAFQHVINLARDTIFRIHNELASTYVEYSGIIDFVGIDSSGDRIKEGSSGDEIFFILPHAEFAEQGMSEIGYWQRDDGNLMRHIDTEPDFNFATADEDSKLGLIVKNLNFSYYNGTAYVSSWDTRKGKPQEGVFPQAVEVKFSVADEKGVTEKEFTTTVRIASTSR